MSEERVLAVVRHFPENGIKQLLHDPANVGELLELAEASRRTQIDYTTMTVDPTNYVTADFRHVSADLVLSASYKPAEKVKGGAKGKGKRKPKLLPLSVLVEHQSQPERLITLRTVDYIVQIHKEQTREWGQEHGSLASVKLHPVIPIVFYTGTLKWERLGRLVDLMDDIDDEDEDFALLSPNFEPYFVKLSGLSQERLAGVGAFGQVLRLVQRRKPAAADFAGLQREVVAAVGFLMESGQRLRWLDLLSYTQALVYHDRKESEHKQLDVIINAALRTDSQRQEIDMVRRSHADVLREEGALNNQREALVGVLTAKFGNLPEPIEALVMNTTDLAKLQEWLVNCAKEQHLADVGIMPQP